MHKRQTAIGSLAFGLAVDDDPGAIVIVPIMHVDDVLEQHRELQEAG